MVRGLNFHLSDTPPQPNKDTKKIGESLRFRPKFGRELHRDGA